MIYNQHINYLLANGTVIIKWEQSRWRSCRMNYGTLSKASSFCISRWKYLLINRWSISGNLVLKQAFKLQPISRMWGVNANAVLSERCAHLRANVERISSSARLPVQDKHQTQCMIWNHKNGGCVPRCDCLLEHALSCSLSSNPAVALLTSKYLASSQDLVWMVDVIFCRTGTLWMVLET